MEDGPASSVWGVWRLFARAPRERGLAGAQNGTVWAWRCGWAPLMTRRIQGDEHETRSKGACLGAQTKGTGWLRFTS
jgi:hypothetical protein